MITLTREQRIALKRVFDRAPEQATSLSWCPPRNYFTNQTYREFRRTVAPGPGCVMVRWMGMWLGIEPDGYTHS